MKICARHYAMNFGITFILRSMRYRMELFLIMGKAVPKYLMLNVRIRVESAFTERLWINDKNAEQHKLLQTGFEGIITEKAVRIKKKYMNRLNDAQNIIR